MHKLNLVGFNLFLLHFILPGISCVSIDSYNAPCLILPMEILRKNYVTISLHRPESLMEVNWLRQPSDKEFKQAYKFSLEVAAQEQLRYYLSDNSMGINLAMALQHWVSALGMDIIGNLNLDRYARVIPPDAFQEIVSYKMFEFLSQQQQTSLEFRVFYNKAEAMRWLQHGTRQFA